MPSIWLVPLVLVGFVLMLAFGIHGKLIDSGLLTQLSQEDSGAVVKLLLGHGFYFGLCVTVLGFALAAWNKFMDKAQRLLDELARQKAASSR